MCMYMCMYRVLAKEWKRGTASLYAIPFPFDVIKGNHIRQTYRQRTKLTLTNLSPTCSNLE